MKKMTSCLMFFVFSLASCQESGKYLVQDIKSKNSWNIIYLKHESMVFKVVNRKVSDSECKEIKVGGYYDMRLKSRRDTAPEIGDIKSTPINKLDVECFAFDEETEICIEPEKGINDIYITDDLMGLCLK